MSAVLSTKPLPSNVGKTIPKEEPNGEFSYMVSPHAAPGEEESDVHDLMINAVKSTKAMMPRLRGGAYTFWATAPARRFMHLLELQGIAYDMTFLPHSNLEG